MTEIPEHLLQRSRERREALGLQTSSGQEPADKPDSGTQGMSTATPEGPATAAAAAEAKPPAVTETAAEPVPEEAVPALSPATEAALRTRIPMWVMPVLLALPFWGILYMGAFGDRTVKKVETPADVYAKAGCSSCHGSSGEGGTGPALAGGASKLTFPNEADHVNWVKTGSSAVSGQKYGDPNRPGGQSGPSTGGMPGFGGQLSDEEINLVVKYERDEL
ncbi:MAG: cytochrome c [Actinomycetota bacterium]|nr:cytochrome c [Actinomycetota bacterium]